jgi:hypothetical protein
VQEAHRVEEPVVHFDRELSDELATAQRAMKPDIIAAYFA